jgi:glycerol-3-phosphate dehydrogenase (NAD(P)+)
MPAAARTSSASSYASVAIIGAGAWGTALAAIAAQGTAKVTLWAREPEIAAEIAAAHENALFLPGVPLSDAIHATADIAEAAAAEAILVAAPAQHVRGVLALLQPLLKKPVPVVLCAKGIELGSGLLLSEVLTEMLPGAEPGMLSGPSFARDVAMGLPTAVTIAAAQSVAARLQATLGRAGFRPYLSEDIVGVALGGAAKNVYAIAAGMVEGAGLGENARAALISRSFAELMRLGESLGARPETLMGLSGLGDLVLTATSMSSRNFALGAALGAGAKLSEVFGPDHPLTEGAATAPALVARARKHGVELPVAEAVADVLAETLDVARAAERLLARPFRPE